MLTFALCLIVAGSYWTAYRLAEADERRGKSALADASVAELRVHGVIGAALAGAGVAMVCRPDLGLDTLLFFSGWMALVGLAGAVRWARGRG